MGGKSVQGGAMGLGKSVWESPSKKGPGSVG